MKKILAAAAVAALLSSPSLAADQAPPPAKASYKPQLVLTTSGFYFGAYATGGMGALNGSALTVAPGVNPNTITAVEAAVGGLVGYYWTTPCPTGSTSCFLAVEGMFGWQNVNGNTQGFSFSGPASFKQRILYGTDVANLTWLTSLFQNLFPIQIPGFPTSIGNVTNIKGYIYGSVDEDDVSISVMAAANRTWSIAPEFGAGTLGQFSANGVIDVFAGVRLPQRGICVGILAQMACANLGTTAVVGTAFKF